MAAETPSTPVRKRPAAKRAAASAAVEGGAAVMTPEKQVAVIPAQSGPVDGQVVTAPPAPAATFEQAQPVAPLHVDVQVAAPAAPQVIIQVKQRGLVVRALYYVFVGWWLSGLMMFAAGLCIGSIVLLPAGLAMVNRLPQVMTLRPRSIAVNGAMLADGSTQYTVGSAQQRSMLVRTVYFCLVGWWAGIVVMFAAWMLSVLIVTMPLGLMLLNRVPAAVTLRRN